jgi:hypothetical protein
MTQRAGIALSRLAYDADYSITRMNYNHCAVFSPPIHHKLVDGYSVDEILNIFDNIVEFDTKLGDNGFAVSIPISASIEQRRAFYDANHSRLNDHFHTWAYKYVAESTLEYTEYKGDVNLLFIDLTPGQVASKLVNGSISKQRWHYSQDGEVYICLDEDFVALNTQDVYDKLVKSIVPTETRLDRVGILRPEGAFPGVSIIDLEYKFTHFPVEWVTLDDLSYGAALVMSREPLLGCQMEPIYIFLPIGIATADGKSVTIFSEEEDAPAERKFILTTSQDDQTTASIRLVRGNEPFGEISLEGMIPRPKGQAAIKFMLSIDDSAETMVTMEEVGTDLKRDKSLGNIENWRSNITQYEAYQRYYKEESKQVSIAIGENGSIGELPE